MNIAEKLYSLYENLPADSGEVMVKANCHDDKKASLSINLDIGLWCCHACVNENTGKKLGGDLIDYVRLQQGYEDMKPKQIQAMIAEEANIETEEVMDIIKKAKNKIVKTESKHVETIPENKVDGWHNMLKGDAEALEKFKKRRGLSDEIIKRYKIGWDGTERYLIPIRDEQGNVINMRKINSFIIFLSIIYKWIN